MKNDFKIFNIIFTASISICILAVTLSCISNYISEKFETIYVLDSDVSHDDSWDGSVEYSFLDETDEADESFSDSRTDSSMANISLIRKTINLAYSIRNKFVQSLSDWTERVTDSSDYYYQSVVANKLFYKICGFNCTSAILIENETLSNNTLDETDIVVDLGDGNLGFVMDEDSINSYGFDNIASLIEFGVDVEADNRNFLFIDLPRKIELTDYAGMSSVVYSDFTSQLREILADSFEEADLNIIFMEDYMTEYGLSAYYKTDHHWTVRTGLIACEVLGNNLNSLFGYNIDVSIFDISNYSVTTLEDFWLGSLGRQATTVYSELDDFEIVVPNYDSDLVVYLSKDNSTSIGSVSETLLDWSQITGEYNLYESSAYNFYGYGSMAYISVHNNLIDDGSNLLLIVTSFANCMVPYFSTTIEDLYVLDLRYFTGSVEEFIEDIDPDTVVVLYNTGVLVNENNWDHTSLFDFR